MQYIVLNKKYTIYQYESNFKSKTFCKKTLAQNCIKTTLNHFENHKNIFLINVCIIKFLPTL